MLLCPSWASATRSAGGLALTQSLIRRPGGQMSYMVAAAGLGRSSDWRTFPLLRTGPPSYPLLLNGPDRRLTGVNTPITDKLIHMVANRNT